jgi:hypothetical protein
MPPLVEPPPFLLAHDLIDGGGHIEDFDDADMDMDMPPLVENPNPSMTFTFATDMTPITYSADPTRFEVVPDASQPYYSYTYTPDTPITPTAFADAASDVPSTPSKGRRERPRDPSYIPRPPNAFILFRSSFIKTQHVPGMGKNASHCTLSKVIGDSFHILFRCDRYSLELRLPGKLWKELPPHEREYWEAKALVAQAEHRKKYPDWRFRPGANALAKARIKDGGGGGRRRRKSRAQEEPRARGKGKQKDKQRDVRDESSSEREGDRRVKNPEMENSRTADTNQTQLSSAPGFADSHDSDQGNDTGRASVESDVSATTSSTSDKRFDVPLTAMFRRSSSAPASEKRASFSPPLPAAFDTAPLLSSPSQRDADSGTSITADLLAVPATNVPFMHRRNSIAVLSPAEQHRRAQHRDSVYHHIPHLHPAGGEMQLPGLSPKMSFTEMLEDAASPSPAPGMLMANQPQRGLQMWPEMPMPELGVSASVFAPLLHDPRIHLWLSIMFHVCDSTRILANFPTCLSQLLHSDSSSSADALSPASIDLYAYDGNTASSPLSSPMTPSLEYQHQHQQPHSPTRSGSHQNAASYTQNPSHYSALEGWAGPSFLHEYPSGGLYAAPTAYYLAPVPTSPTRLKPVAEPTY